MNMLPIVEALERAWRAHERHDPLEAEAELMKAALECHKAVEENEQP